MSWRLEISHVTRYRYDRPVVASYNEARSDAVVDGRPICERNPDCRTASHSTVLLHGLLGDARPCL